jgi:signal transduction histidine kinase
LLALAGGTVMARQVLRPVRGLIGALGPIIKTGKTDARVPVPRTGDELEELGVLFNRALEKIERLIEGMGASLDNVAHDLRTPMTRLRGTAEMALQSGSGSDPCREALADCLEESEQVLTMLNTLMDISEVDTGSVRLAMRELELGVLIDQVEELYRPIAEEKGLTLRVDHPGNLTLVADRNRLLQALANLVDNAIKYTPSGGKVRVQAVRQDSTIRVTVCDSGVGIPTAELDRVWDRFYRGDESRTQRGLGLGLSLVQAVVKAHRGRVEVASEPGHGSQFVVHLPPNR